MTSRSRGLLGRRSNKQSPVEERSFVAVIDSSLSSGCNSMYPIPSAYRSIFKKVGLFESKRAKTGEVMRLVLHKWNNHVILLSTKTEDFLCGGISFAIFADV